MVLYSMTGCISSDHLGQECSVLWNDEDVCGGDYGAFFNIYLFG